MEELFGGRLFLLDIVGFAIFISVGLVANADSCAQVLGWENQLI